MAQIAVIKTGGKQYIVEPGAKIEIEKLPQAQGEEVTFDTVLLIGDGENMTLGTPLVGGAKVTGKIVKQDKQDKIRILKFKAKKREKKWTGHRQPYTEVEITGIVIK
ncbi:MAG: 50S ribosomal protein L21 [Candidatus Wildermuthbacteria bacterium]|nr:50S ribosomal protein L21 [Candidatus Wildermuthbacteria bacterium]